MTHIPQEDLLSELEDADGDSVRVLGTDSMAIGLKRYQEPTADKKGMRTHTSDELYYVLSGAGTMTVGDETHSVAAGDLLAVEEGVGHDIVDVTEEMTVLKVFATAS